MTGGRGRGRRKLLYGRKERTGYSHLKEEALDRTMRRARFGRGFGPIIRQTSKWMNTHTHTHTHTYTHTHTHTETERDSRVCKCGPY